MLKYQKRNIRRIKIKEYIKIPTTKDKNICWLMIFYKTVSDVYNIFLLFVIFVYYRLLKDGVMIYLILIIVKTCILI